MKVSEIKDKNIWEGFLSGCRDKTFLDSWNWGVFQEKMGNKIWRFGVFDGEELLGIALVSLILAKRGKFFLIQHGPVVKEGRSREEVLKSLIGELRNREKVDFLRLNPLWKRDKENKALLRVLGFKEAL